jgi:site-specific recombinase XerD
MTKNYCSPSPILMPHGLDQSVIDATDYVMSTWSGTTLPLDSQELLLFSNQFLYAYRGNNNSFRNYRKEIEKLFQWCWTIKLSSPNELTPHDIEEFIQFCIAPPASWISKGVLKRFNKLSDLNEKWRPFSNQKQRYELTQGSLVVMFSILGSYYNYMIDMGITDINPVRGIRQKKKYIQSSSIKKVMRFSNDHTALIFSTCEEQVSDDPKKYGRLQWLISLLLTLYLRISEVAEDDLSSPKMSDFEVDHHGDTWLNVLGKGNKIRKVSISDGVLASLERYRSSHGLSDFPLPSESYPLVSSLININKSIGIRQVRREVDELFKATAIKIKSKYGETEANEFKEGTVHWLRHTGISEDVKVRPKEHVKEEAGHNSLATTDRYIDIELKERAKSRRTAYSENEINQSTNNSS